MKKILVTGANGFVGQRLCAFLAKQGISVKAAVRHADTAVYPSSLVEKTILGSLENWDAFKSGMTDVFSNVDTVVHLASRVHMMQEVSLDPFSEYQKVNVKATENLANAAVKFGVRRFIYVSSIKVNGEHTVGEQRFSELDLPNPQDHYGQSKWDAERALREIAKATGLEVVIIRPPLVYGKGVKANFQKLIQAIKNGWPLPLGAVNNKRSLIYVENLVDAIFVCLNSEKARNQTYLLSDGDDVSTPELIRRLAIALHKPAKLLSFPPISLRLAAALTGKRAGVERLLSSLRVDNRQICSDLNWQPPYQMEEAFHRDFSKMNASS